MNLGNMWIDWPDKPGFYWFYGCTNYEMSMRHDDKSQPELVPVVARQGSAGLVVHRWSEFIYRSWAKGLFLPLDTPDLPELNGT